MQLFRELKQNRPDTPDPVIANAPCEQDLSDHSSSASEQDIEDNNNLVLQKLRHVIVTKKMSESLTNTMLSQVFSIHDCFRNIPKTRRAILGTRRRVEGIERMGEGSYYHFGVQDQILKVLKKNRVNAHSIKNIGLILGIDGRPPKTGGQETFWVILGHIRGMEQSEVFPIGIHSGPSKPEDPNVFLSKTVNEIIQLVSHGIVYDNVTVSVSLDAVILDASAKCFLLNCQWHTGKYCCPKCYIVGLYILHRVCFPAQDARARTHASFCAKTDRYFHNTNEECILKRVPGFDIIKNVPIDYMHCLLLGIIKKILQLLFQSSFLRIRVNRATAGVVNERLKILVKWMPCEFQRKPRSMAFLNTFKATELRQILLYTCVTVLEPLVAEGKKDYCDMFISLHYAVRLLARSPTRDDVNDARNLIRLVMQHILRIVPVRVNRLA